MQFARHVWVTDSWKFLTQKELDPDTVGFNSNNNRYHFPARFYLPSRGVFGQVDPLLVYPRQLQWWKSQGRRTRSILGRIVITREVTPEYMSLYSYGHANPTYWTDPLGLQVQGKPQKPRKANLNPNCDGSQRCDDGATDLQYWSEDYFKDGPCPEKPEFCDDSYFPLPKKTYNDGNDEIKKLSDEFCASATRCEKCYCATSSFQHDLSCETVKRKGEQKCWITIVWVINAGFCRKPG
jgi:hypothetical protein